MIDTIEFVLHEVNERQFDMLAKSGTSFKNGFNQMLYERLMEYESVYIERTKDFTSYQEIQNPDGSDFKRRETGINTVLSSRRGAVHTSPNTHEVFFHRVRGQISTASSDYRVSFSISENADAITFNLSIPKYFYGTNVIQFVPQIYSDRYRKNQLTMRYMSKQVEVLHQRLIEFFYTFFDDLSIYLNLPSIANLDLTKIEVKRLDYCFNQYFPSETMVQDYIIAQKKIFESRIKKNTLVGNETDSSLYYRHSTDGFYFKIYMKGKEFINNDLQRLIKENEEYFDKTWFQKSKDYVDVFKEHFPDIYKRRNGRIQDLIFSYYKSYVNSEEFDKIAYVKALEKHLKIKLRFLLDESKLILRYEMSFTRTYMSTLYKRHIYRKKDKNWKTLLENYKKITRYNLLVSQGKINQAEAYKNKELVDFTALFRYATDKESAIYSDKRLSVIMKDYNVVDRALHKKHEFYIKTTNDIKATETYLSDLEFKQHRTQKKYKILDIKQATLTPELLKIMSKMFEEEIQFFQIKEIEETTTILDQLEKYNKNAESKRLIYIKNFGEQKYKELTHTKKRKLGLTKISITKLKPVLDLLDKGKSLIQAFEYLGIKTSQRYVYEDDLKRFDIRRQNVKRTFSIFKPKTDFSAYYEKFFLQNYSYIFINQAMISFDTIRNHRQ